MATDEAKRADLLRALGHTSPLEQAQTPQPARVTVFDPESGQPMERYRIDAEAAVAAGRAVRDPREAKNLDPEVAALLAEGKARRSEADLTTWSMTELKEEWDRLNPGAERDPRLGELRLIEEILEFRARPPQQDAPPPPPDEPPE